VTAVPEILPSLVLHAFAGGVAGAIIAAVLAPAFSERVAASAAVAFVLGAFVTGPLFLLQLWLEVRS
jgi:hypothetical protein